MLDLQKQLDTLNWGYSGLGDGGRDTAGDEILGEWGGVKRHDFRCVIGFAKIGKMQKETRVSNTPVVREVVKERKKNGWSGQSVLSEPFAVPLTSDTLVWSRGGREMCREKFWRSLKTFAGLTRWRWSEEHRQSTFYCRGQHCLAQRKVAWRFFECLKNSEQTCAHKKFNLNCGSGLCSLPQCSGKGDVSVPCADWNVRNAIRQRGEMELEEH